MTANIRTLCIVGPTWANPESTSLLAARAKGVTEIAKQAGVTRASLYKSLAEGGKPKYDTILKVIKALGCRLAVV
jgi:probable addiction module antidote protein